MDQKDIDLAKKLRERGYSNKEIAEKLNVKKWQVKAVTKGGAKTPDEVKNMKSKYKKSGCGTFGSDYDYSTVIVPTICM